MSNETPFHVISGMESTLVLVDNCLKHIEHCCRLHDKLAKLNDYERKEDSTKILLILAKYGSKDEFMTTIENATNESNKTLTSLETYVKNMKWALKAKAYECPRCHGRGSFSKTEYIRERGHIQSILRSISCDDCNGTGEMHISPVVETYLSLFLEMVAKIVLFQKLFQNTLNIFEVKAKE